MKVTRYRIEFDCPACGTLVQKRNRDVKLTLKDPLTPVMEDTCPLCSANLTVLFDAEELDKIISKKKAVPTRKTKAEKDNAATKIKSTKVILPQDGKKRKVLTPNKEVK